MATTVGTFTQWLEQARITPERLTAERGATASEVAPASVGSTSQRFVQVVEVPEDARNVRFYAGASRVPAKYRHALQDVR
jgi:hypothetical protein